MINWVHCKVRTREHLRIKEDNLCEGADFYLFFFFKGRLFYPEDIKL